MVGGWWLVSTSLQPPPGRLSFCVLKQIDGLPRKIVPWEEKVGNKKKEREEKEKKEKEKKEKEKKEKEKKEKDKIVPWEEKVRKEKNQKEKEKEREGHPTLATIMEERVLGGMPSDEVGVPPEAAPPRLLAYR